MSETAGRYALLIGANRYDDARLKSLQSPAADLGALGEVLADPALGDFVVDSLLDETCQAVRIGIERFLSGRTRDDVVLIYCSVHGLKDERGRLYLALRDTERDVLRATGMSSSFLLEALASCRSSAKVLILDCDYSGAVLSEAPTPEGTIILTATSALAYAFEDADRQHGLFTAHLVQGLRSGDADLDGDGAITFEELFAYVRACVIEAQTDQSPRLFNLTETSIRAASSPKHVFVSYSRADTAFVRWLERHLRAWGHRTWIDEGEISGGTEWRARIASAIDRAKVVVVVISPDALVATWVRREMEYADEIGKPLIPIIVRPADLPAWFTIAFGGLQRLDLVDESSRTETVVRLREAIAQRARSEHLSARMGH